MSERAGSRSRSMIWRVGWVAVSSAALGGLVAAVLAIVAVDRLIARHADVRLSAATVTLAGELDEDKPTHRRARLRGTLEDENEEIVTSGIRLAVFESGVLLAGDAWMTAPRPGTCETRRVSAGGGRVRACAGAYHSWTLVAAQPIDELGLYLLYGLSALGAVLLGAGTGALLSVGLSRWAVHPLRALSQSVRDSPAERPGSLDLGPASSCSEVEALRAAIYDLTSRLQVLIDQAQRFAADAAHELRTPMTALRAELELLSEESSGKDRAAIERASARLRRLSSLMERLLVLALPTENLRSGFETISLSDVVEEVCRELNSEEHSRVCLELKSEGLVRGDARLLTTLVENALRNALKFASTGPVWIRLRDQGTTQTTEVILEVQDTGPGIALALRERVFEAFYRADPRATRGHGLGLALIGHIARAHQGRAQFADSTRGALLSVRFPAWTPEAQPTET